MRLLYLSPVPWLSFSQRPHKFVEWFHGRTGDEVLWVDPYPTRFPSLSDLRRLGAKEDRHQCSNPPWLRVIRPPALPIEPLLGSGWVNALLWQRLFCELDAFDNQHGTLLAIGKPSALALAMVSRFRGGASLYDAMDDFPAFYAGLSSLAMRRREKQLVRRVCTVLASSTAIQQRWSTLRGDVRLVHNGLDLNVLPPPKTIDSTRTQKVFGYLGTIASWFDWEWVIQLAKARPLDEVRLIGPVFSPVPLPMPQNIKMLPACNHQAALVAMQDFDVGLIPFKKNELTASVDPIKYYEYRALGLPVISTDFGEMALRFNEEGAFISAGIEDINCLVLKAFEFRPDTNQVLKFAASNSWSIRFDRAGIL
ncbi:MAG: putative teichuronic acid biosynthesis glycosyltransferase TuaH [Dehalococcoidia bacterium]|nr:putative teichuronic acid biosynthesis glycosyltransferase TuaH [Chloroflexota bacterium]MBT9161781.1 putative teichuronic acid biosynthesis glycosyltransferase TuaH [Chloroflexota bacterium]